jgi:hypothetical protein
MLLLLPGVTAFQAVKEAAVVSVLELAPLLPPESVESVPPPDKVALVPPPPPQAVKAAVALMSRAN